MSASLLYWRRKMKNFTRYYTTLVLLLIAAAITPGVRAQETPKPQPAIQETTAPYLLGPEDQISVNVINFSNLSVPQVVVPPDGQITMPLLEPINVIGKTTQEVARLLTEKWREYVVNPSVTVTLSVKRRQDNIIVYGFVQRAGTIEYRPMIRLLRVLAEAGGAAPNGDLANLTLIRANGEKKTLDLSHPETRAGTPDDLLLERGDLIYIPERRAQISVLGEVMRPGNMEYREEMTLLEAITNAGGVKETADLAAATLIHNGKESKVNLEALLRRGDLSINIKLSAGDRLLIPELSNRVYVFGAVGRPGFYNFKPGDRVVDALKEMGGPLREADLTKVNHIRVDSAKNTAKVETVNVEQLLKKGDLKGNIALEPGDFLYIPDKRKKFGIQDLFGLVAGVNLFSSIGRLFTGGF